MNKELQDFSLYSMKGKRLAITRGDKLPATFVVWEIMTTTQENFERIMQVPFPQVEEELNRIKDDSITMGDKVKKEILARKEYGKFSQSELEDLIIEESEKDLSNIIEDINSRIIYGVLLDLLEEYYDLGKI